ncbi:nucleotidyltransferase family protein [Parafrankia sp. BMG5.11]|uniref:nucleotidyltransferase family protein n=1 Tax=Parafrankia sp. BMG5.11 TaxID=222540 RepID=UPI00103F9D95|nr:nucleotidyltransferase family protein [Parafrankia sp. BMG5.11]TCJ41424.1 hypothetical protein E0504_02145 [Parafrankia sp. BMG5.11]
MSGPAARAVVLAGQRAGTVNALAQRFGLSHKALIPVRGEPLITYVARTLADHERISEIVISAEPEAFDPITEVLRRASISTAKVSFTPAAGTLPDSVFAAVGKHAGPILITTADHALLTAASVDAMLDAVTGSDVAIGMANKASVLAAHAEGQRRFYRFRDDEYSNCNLYAMADRSSLAAAEVFRGGGQFAKNVGRIVEAFGLLNLVLMRLSVLSLAAAMRRISRRIGRTVTPVIIRDGSQAIDVDNDRTLGCVEDILARRAGPSAV